MQWLYLFTGSIIGVIALYHLFTNKLRKSVNDDIVYELKDPSKISTKSRIYKISLISAYAILVLNAFLFIQIFSNMGIATILFLIIFPLGLFVLISLDRIFELREDAIVFAGYHARWGLIHQFKWGKQGKKRTMIIMELSKGTKIKTTIPNEEVATLEEFISDYVDFK